MYVTRCQRWLSQTLPSWTTLNKKLFSSDSAHHFMRDLETIASSVMCFGAFRRKSFGNGAISSSSVEMNVSCVSHLATLERSMQDVSWMSGR